MVFPHFFFLSIFVIFRQSFSPERSTPPSCANTAATRRASADWLQSTQIHDSCKRKGRALELFLLRSRCTTSPENALILESRNEPEGPRERYASGKSSGAGVELLSKNKRARRPERTHVLAHVDYASVFREFLKIGNIFKFEVFRTPPSWRLQRLTTFSQTLSLRARWHNGRTNCCPGRLFYTIGEEGESKSFETFSGKTDARFIRSACTFMENLRGPKKRILRRYKSYFRHNTIVDWYTRVTIVKFDNLRKFFKSVTYS